MSLSCGNPSTFVRKMALGCCCERRRLRIIFIASTRRSIFIPPAVEPAQAHTMEQNMSIIIEKAVHVLQSSVANPVVLMYDTTWNAA